MTDPTPISNEPPDKELGSSTRSWIRGIVRVASVFILLIVLVASLAYWLSIQAPDFYLWSATQKPTELKRLSDRFETTALDLQNRARSQDDWQVVFRDSEINAWLATELEKKFPGTTPKNFEHLQIKTEEKQLRIAMHGKLNSLETVFNVTVDVFFTETPGELAIQIKESFAGKLPIPVSIFANTLSDSLSSTRLPVTWTESEKLPTVLVQLPPEAIKLGDRTVQLESLQLLAGEIALTGKSPQSDGQ